jgi:hypothetical protein
MRNAFAVLKENYQRLSLAEFSRSLSYSGIKDVLDVIDCTKAASKAAD